MIAGFAVSLLLARITPLHYVFLTGHHVLFMATLLTIVLATAGYNGWVVIAFGAVLLGILIGVSSRARTTLDQERHR